MLAVKPITRDKFNFYGEQFSNKFQPSRAFSKNNHDVFIKSKPAQTLTFKGSFKNVLSELNKIEDECIKKLAESDNKSLIGFFEFIENKINLLQKNFIYNLSDQKGHLTTFKDDFLHDIANKLVFSKLAVIELSPKDPNLLPSVGAICSKMFKDLGKTYKTYEFFIDNNLGANDTTIGLKKLVNLVHETFAIGLKHKNLALTIQNPELIEAYNEKMVLDYKNYTILSNLLGNAIKYSPNGSEIELGFLEKNNKLFVYLKDNGIGIPQDEHSRVLLGQRGSNVGKTNGTGFGLKKIQKIIDFENYGEKISITSPLYPEAPKYKGTMIEVPLCQKK